MTANATGITPTIVQIREDWISAMITPSDYWDAISEEEAEARFARALAAHDAQVLRDFADRMANGIYLETGGSAHHEAFNRAHMDAATLARAEATRIEEGQG